MWVNRCITGLLRSKTRLVVTDNAHHARLAYGVVLMSQVLSPSFYEAKLILTVYDRPASVVCRIYIYTPNTDTKVEGVYRANLQDLNTLE